MFFCHAILHKALKFGGGENRTWHDNDHAWKQYAKGAYDALLTCISAHKAENILVVGHGNIINSLGLMIKLEATDLQNIYFGYCEGFTVLKKLVIFVIILNKKSLRQSFFCNFIALFLR